MLVSDTMRVLREMGMGTPRLSQHSELVFNVIDVEGLAFVLLFGPVSAVAEASVKFRRHFRVWVF